MAVRQKVWEHLPIQQRRVATFLALTSYHCTFPTQMKQVIFRAFAIQLFSQLRVDYFLSLVFVFPKTPIMNTDVQKSSPKVSKTWKSKVFLCVNFLRVVRELISSFTFSAETFIKGLSFRPIPMMCFKVHGFPECYFPECHFPECHFPECHFPECHFPECHFPECYLCHSPSCEVRHLTIPANRLGQLEYF